MKKSLFAEFLAAPVSFLKRIGFKIDEEMVGTHRFDTKIVNLRLASDRPFRFDVTWGTDSIWQWLQPGDDFLVSELFGTVTADGLGDHSPCNGTLALRYFDEHRLRYDFQFEKGCQLLRFVGEKVNIRPWNLLVSHTTCIGRITDEKGRLISTALVFFRLRDIPRFLRSFRLTFDEE